MFALAIAAATYLPCIESSPLLLASKAKSEEVTLLLRPAKSATDKVTILSKEKSVVDALAKYPELETFFATASADEKYVLSLMICLNQLDTIFEGFTDLSHKQEALKKLCTTLVNIENFYAPIGGVLGYHSTVIKLMTAPDPSLEPDQYLPPPVHDIRTKNNEVWKTCYEGVARLGSVAMILPLGGAGDRLNLIDERTKEPLPAARLSFCGRSLFEGLMRDVEAQEYWHYRTFGKQVTMPILIMTSTEKNNDQHIEAMGNEAKWFGHHPYTIRRIIQPLVPVIDTEGQWAVSAPLELALKPGGHGVLWKLAQDSGAVQWLTFHGIDAALIRQVNNPLASLDQGFFTLIGYGLSHHKSFGFLSCPSKPGFAEGLNVLSVKKTENTAQASISNIEYTQFSMLKNLLPNLFKEGVCPANTNILYIDLHQIEGALVKDPIPGMIVNAKTAVEVRHAGEIIKKIGGRLESCMQNIADGLMSPVCLEKLPTIQEDSLSTFLLLQDREKLMSVAKKAYQPGQNAGETPASCLYDWNRAMRELLVKSCSFTLPPEQTFDEFLRDGPSVTFSFHPAMGPLWEVIGQKLSKGKLTKGSELELDLAEVSCTNLSVDGSLRVIAKTATGPISGTSGRKYSDKVGRAKLSNVTVINKGVKTGDVNALLKGSVERNETCEIVLDGFSELVASNVTLSGDFHLVVPDGKRAILTQGSSGEIVTSFEEIHSPGWTYAVEWKSGTAPLLVLKEAA